MTREEAIEEIRYYCVDSEEIIKALEQEPKTGHWINTGAYYTGAYGTIDYVECSCCHYESLEEGDYCPNCGCRMVEPQESEEE
jgi:hypothetical protein